MSNFEGPLSSQPEWQGHYSYLPPGEPNIFAQPFQQVSGSNASNTAAAVPRPSSVSNTVAETSTQPGTSATASPIAQSRPVDTQGLRAPKVESPVNESPESRVLPNGIKTEHAQEESSVSAPATSSSASAATSNEQGRDISSLQSGNDDIVLGKEEEEDIVDDDEMLDVEGDGEGEVMGRPMTAAERTAARRKMKRFRYVWADLF